MQDVRKALVSAIATHAPLDEEAAEGYMKRVEAQRRYLQVLSTESGPLRVVHLSRHKWPGELVN